MIGDLPSQPLLEYTPFFSISGSDHAGIILDINTDKIFPRRSQVQTFQSRGLYSNNYKQLPRYIEKVFDHLDSNNAFEKMERLKQNDQLDIASIEKIDQIISQAAFSGEKTIRRRRKPWWSVEMHHTRYSLNIINKAISQVKKGKYNQIRLQLQLDQHQCDVELPSSLKELLELRQTKRQQIREITKQSRERRDEFLQDHATNTGSQGQDKKAKIIKAIQHTERVNKAFKTMAHIRKPVQQNGINRIQIPTSWGTPQEAMNNPENLEDPSQATNWREITDLAEI